jgi:hypothetical protein
MSQRLIVLALLTLALSPAAKGEAPRRSADGVDLPPVTAPAAFRATLPIVRDKLGAAPEELGGRIYHSATSKDLLAKRSPKASAEDGAWFTFGTLGADVVCFDLTGGRVTRLVLIYNQPRPQVQQQVASGMRQATRAPGDDRPDAYAVKNAAAGGGPFVVTVRADVDRVTAQLDGVDWALATDKGMPAAIAAAMRARKPAEGMTLDQMQAMFGRPAEASAEGGGDTTYEWRIKGFGPGQTVVPTGDAAADAQNLGNAIAAGPSRVVKRRITAAVKDGHVVKFTDDHYGAQ